MARIGPSLMCADWGRLKETIEMLDHGGVDYYHFDIMDGSFVPNFTMGPDLLKALRKYTDKPFDIHMMIQEPERYIGMFAEAGADSISVHAESRTHLQRTLQQIRSLHLKAGIALNPSTPLSVLDYVLDVADYVCLMTVNPGFAGQKFIPSMYKKIADLKKMIDEYGVPVEIQVDGNIGYDTIPKVLELGASMLVCGTSSLFSKLLLGDCVAVSAQLNPDIPLEKEFAEIVRMNNEINLDPKRPIASLTHGEHMPTLPQDLQTIDKDLSKAVEDLYNKAIVSGDKYTVQQAMDEARKQWDSRGGKKLEEFYAKWYVENKDKAFLRDDLYQFLPKK